MPTDAEMIAALTQERDALKTFVTDWMSKFEARQKKMDEDLADLKADDAKVHGIITWVNTAIVNNPKVTAVVTMLATAAGAWLMAHFGVIGQTVEVPGTKETVIEKHFEPAPKDPSKVSPLPPPKWENVSPATPKGDGK